MKEQLRAVIVDDIPDARLTLKADLEEYCPHIQVIGEAEGVVTGAKAIRTLKPQVVFLDIQMKDGSGFDLLEILGPINCKVIFTTASDAFAIKAFRYAAVDYLLKPIDPDELMEAVKKLGNDPNSDPESLKLLKKQLDNPRKTHENIALHTQEKIHIVAVRDIVRLESNGNYTRFFFQDGSKLLVTKTLKEFDALFQEHRFIRVHQSHLVNPGFLKEFVKSDGGYLVMKDGANVPVSTRKRNEVLQQIDLL